MQMALQRLGYKCYHMLEAGKTSRMGHWLEGLKAKYEGQGKPFGRTEFDKLLQDYSVRDHGHV